MTTKTIHLYCTCGAAWKGMVSGDVSKPYAAWERIHSGLSHQRCDAKAAARARAKAKKEWNDAE